MAKSLDTETIENQLNEIDNSISIVLDTKDQCLQKNGIIMGNISLNNSENIDLECISLDEDDDDQVEANAVVEHEITCNCKKHKSDNSVEIQGKLILDVPLCYLHINIAKLKKYVFSRISKGLRIPTDNIEIVKINPIDQKTELFWNINITNKKMLEIIKIFPNPSYDNNNFLKVIHGLLFLISKSFKDFPKKNLTGNCIAFYITKYHNYESLQNIYVSINI